MSTLSSLLAAGLPAPFHAPWPRATIDAATWRQATARLTTGEWTLLGLWGERDRVHMAVLADAPREIGVLTLACPDGRFPSVGLHHRPAIRLERTVRDLFGLEPMGAEDARPWLDHGTWTGGMPADYAFLPVHGENLHEIPVGPVHAGIIEPGHFRFTADGETIVRLEQRLGYTHKGTESLLAGADLDRAAQLAGRISGDATVAYAAGFARAAEAALDITPPPRAVWLRALMAELERIANHLGDFGAICNDASFAIMHAHCGILRERVLRTAASCFGHRLMMDRIVPGGVAVDISATGIAEVAALVGEIRPRLAQLVHLYDTTASLLERTVTTGVARPDLVRQFGAGGHVGRASGRDFDSRKWPGYAPYNSLRFDIPVLTEGDVNARVWIRIREIGESLGLIEQILAGLPAGALRIGFDPATGTALEGMALTESFRGDVLAWLRIEADGRIGRCHFRDPSWFHWPLLEVAVYGNIVADFPLCNKSFNCSYSGHDL